MNLLRDLPAADAGEIVERLTGSDIVRIERIVSRGEASPEGFWYDQDEAEFVLVLAGATRLRFADGEVMALGPGDWVDIAPHRRHRVDWTDPDRPTVWLAIFYPSCHSGQSEAESTPAACPGTTIEKDEADAKPAPRPRRSVSRSHGTLRAGDGGRGRGVGALRVSADAVYDPDQSGG